MNEWNKFVNWLDPSNMDMSCEAKAMAVLEKRQEMSLSVLVNEAYRNCRKKNGEYVTNQMIPAPVAAELAVEKDNGKTAVNTTVKVYVFCSQSFIPNSLPIVIQNS